jgi:hypothetical protein
MGWNLARAQQHARSVEREEFAGLGIHRRHIVTVGQLLAEEASRLARLRGAALVHYAVLWDSYRNEWFTDELMWLDFGESQLSLWAYQTYLCLSWDPPDTEGRIEFWTSTTFPKLVWRSDGIPEMDRLVGKPLEFLAAGEYQGELDALVLGSGAAYCEVCNAGDELGVRRAPPPSHEFSRTILWDDRHTD